MSTDTRPEVAHDELLARFITREHWLRADLTVKPDAFVPPKDLHLSVTRHVGLTEAALWSIGRGVLRQVTGDSGASLRGRADLAAGHVAELHLRTEPAPRADNANHAHIVGWPGEKAARKMVAQELAARAVFQAAPA